METTTNDDSPDQVLTGLLATRIGRHGPVVVAGEEWAVIPSYDVLRPVRSIRREVAAGTAEIGKAAGAANEDRFFLRVKVEGLEEVAIEALTYHQDLPSAIAAAKAFTWTVREFLGRIWYLQESAHSLTWRAYLGPGQVAELAQHKSTEYPDFTATRKLSAATGERIEMSLYRSIAVDESHAITTFEEAAGIALSLPILAASHMMNATQTTWPAAPGQTAPAEA